MLAAHEAGADLRDQAVLMRAAGHSDVLEVELSVRGIPFIKYGGLRFTEAAHVKDFLAAARVVANPADDIAWFRLLRLHEGVGPVHARRVIDAMQLGGAELELADEAGPAAGGFPPSQRSARSGEQGVQGAPPPGTAGPTPRPRCRPRPAPR